MFHFFARVNRGLPAAQTKFNRARKLNWVDQKNFLKLLTEKILVKYNTEPKFASVSLVRVEKKLQRLLLKKKNSWKPLDHPWDLSYMPLSSSYTSIPSAQ